MSASRIATDDASGVPDAGDAILPSLTDEMAWRASGPLGGPWGRRAAVGQRSWWTPVRWLLLMTMVTLLLGFAEKSPCANAQWTGDKEYTHFCYSDVIPLWGNERLDVGAVPYRDTAVEYPVLTGGFMWLTAGLTRGIHAVHTSWPDVVVFGVLTAILLSVCGLVTTAATTRTAGRRPYDAAIFALSPLLVFHAFSNWDLLATAFMALALLAWARQRPVLAGAMIGLGTAAKLYPVFLLVAIGILALRTRKWADAGWATATAVVSWLTVNLPIALAYHRGWWQFYKFSIDRPAERSTIWAMARTAAVASVQDADTAFWKPPGLAVALALVAALLLIAWLGLRAPIRPRLAQLVFLCVLAFLLTTKVWSPQYSLWLVPLLALARPRWRLALLWQFTEILVWMLTLTLLLGYDTPGHGVSYGWLMLVLIVRDVLLLVIAGFIVREMWRPWLDGVRVNGIDDPSGGVFDGAPDGWDAYPDADEFTDSDSGSDSGEDAELLSASR